MNGSRSNDFPESLDQDGTNFKWLPDIPYSEELMQLIENIDPVDLCVSPESTEESMDLDTFGASAPLSNEDVSFVRCTGQGNQLIQGDTSDLRPSPPIANQSSFPDTDSGTTAQPPADHVTSVMPSQPSDSVSSTSDSNPEIPLPNVRDFNVVVSIQRSRMIEFSVVNPHSGCVIFYPRAVDDPAVKKGQIELPITTTVSKTKEDGTPTQESIAWPSPSVEKYTMRILEGLGRGLKVGTDEYGNLYAKRQCMAKVFWTSTQKDDDKAVELERDVDTQVFDLSTFSEQYKEALNTVDAEVVRPAVRFVFAQKWDVRSEPFNSKLLTARIEPLRANRQVEWYIKEARSNSYYDSHHSGLMLLSR